MSLLRRRIPHVRIRNGSLYGPRLGTAFPMYFTGPPLSTRTMTQDADLSTSRRYPASGYDHLLSFVPSTPQGRITFTSKPTGADRSLWHCHIQTRPPHLKTDADITFEAKFPTAGNSIMILMSTPPQSRAYPRPHPCIPDASASRIARTRSHTRTATVPFPSPAYMEAAWHTEIPASIHSR